VRPWQSFYLASMSAQGRISDHRRDGEEAVTSRKVIPAFGHKRDGRDDVTR